MLKKTRHSLTKFFFLPPTCMSQLSTHLAVLILQENTIRLRTEQNIQSSERGKRQFFSPQSLIVQGDVARLY